MREELRKVDYICIPPTGQAETLKRLSCNLVHMSGSEETSESLKTLPSILAEYDTLIAYHLDSLFCGEHSAESLQHQPMAISMPFVIREDQNVAGGFHAK